MEIQTRDQILNFLDNKIKSNEDDPDGKWITAWNHYLSHLKYFFRWLYNIYKNNRSQNGTIDNITTYPFSYDDWETPVFIQIKKKKTKRLSPYLETELWDRDEKFEVTWEVAENVLVRVYTKYLKDCNYLCLHSLDVNHVHI